MLCVFIGIYHLGESNEYTQHTIISIKSPEIIPNTVMFAAMGFFIRDSRTSLAIKIQNSRGIQAISV